MKWLKISVVFGVGLGLVSFLMVWLGVSYYVQNFVIFVEWELYSLNSVSVIMTILLDWMSLTFSGVVMFISSMVMVYITKYMEGDPNYVRFTWLVLLFVASMGLLIVSPNIISILLGWDGLGFISYCLVIYYQNVKSANAGMLTILSNRVGDIAILLMISWFLNFGGWNFYYLGFLHTQVELMLVCGLVLLAGLTKSAQVPFSAWLPAAMAAPTPVSALVHSSTLVTAGVYLFIRFSNLIGVSLGLVLISVMTMFLSGVNANLEMDLKKVIALSTLSQLGVMVMAISLGLVEMAYFHMLSHALFKSLLFLCAGVFIHSASDVQDVRDLGGVSVSNPLTSLYFVTCSLALCGFPYLSGFYSKDILLENYFLTGGLNLFLWLTIVLCILLTSIYSARLAYMLFIKPAGGGGVNCQGEALLMSSPMSLLYYSALTGGSVMMWWFSPPVMIFLTLWVKLFVLVLVVVLISLISLNMSSFKLLTTVGGGLKHYFGLMMNLPYLSTFMVMSNLKVGMRVLSLFDQGWVEYLGGQGIFKGVSLYSSKVDGLNLLGVKFYLMVFFIFTLIVVMTV